MNARSKDGIYHQVEFLERDVRRIFDLPQIKSKARENIPVPPGLICSDIFRSAQEIDGCIKSAQMASGDEGIAAIVSATCHYCYPISSRSGRNLTSQGAPCIFHELQGQQSKMLTISIKCFHLFRGDRYHIGL
ncbi:Uncharacterised protein [uncultured archaeon]|nr:Uncharacterised protein [uncultured archaeon]